MFLLADDEVPTAFRSKDLGVREKEAESADQLRDRTSKIAEDPHANVIALHFASASSHRIQRHITLPETLCRIFPDDPR